MPELINAPSMGNMRAARADSLGNSDIAELLPLGGENAKQPIQKALRHASRRAFLWPEEAADLIQQVALCRNLRAWTIFGQA
jgi:hypothetical protein